MTDDVSLVWPIDADRLHPALGDAAQILRECERITARGSGPGGQHRNKTDSHVHLRHRPTGVTAVAGERRSQRENEQVAVKRLRVNLALVVRSEALGDASPTALWKGRIRNGRIEVNVDHDDFGGMLAEALEVVIRLKCQAPAAAERLGCTASQLVKFLAKAPRALAHVNEERVRHGLDRIRPSGG